MAAGFRKKSLLLYELFSLRPIKIPYQYQYLIIYGEYNALAKNLMLGMGISKSH